MKTFYCTFRLKDKLQFNIAVKAKSRKKAKKKAKKLYKLKLTNIRESSKN